MTALALSRHNIICPIAGGGDWYILNPLSQRADIITEAEARAIQDGTYEDAEKLVERGYLVDPQEEARRFRQAYLDYGAARDREEIQLFFVPGYSCNFACDYCYQESYEPEPSLGLEVVDAFVAHVDRHFGGRGKYVTLFGGEPLLPSASRRAVIERLVDALRERNIDLSVVTNGYDLVSYLPLLSRAKLREIQITLDGVGPVHDRRRPLKGGGGTFEAVVGAVDATLEADVAVNLRVVVDRDNLQHLPDLARFAIERGWTKHPRFKTQLGRNYELHTCPVGRDRLYSRIDLHQQLLTLAKEHPEFLEFHRPAFSVARHIADHSALPSPQFDACPGTKTEWAFDGTGRIYACTATVGKQQEVLGRFHPEAAVDEDAVAEWEDRDALAIEACTSCAAQLVCGGGCASVAKNRTGELHAPDCRPIADLVGLGLDLYVQSR